jgi:hypothetical protein
MIGFLLKYYGEQILGEEFPSLDLHSSGSVLTHPQKSELQCRSEKPPLTAAVTSGLRKERRGLPREAAYVYLLLFGPCIFC